METVPEALEHAERPNMDDDGLTPSSSEQFSRDELNSADPQKLAQGLSRTVIYHRPKDDLTSTVLKMLNQSYEQAGNVFRPVRRYHPRRGGLPARGGSLPGNQPS